MCLWATSSYPGELGPVIRHAPSSGGLFVQAAMSQSFSKTRRTGPAVSRGPPCEPINRHARLGLSVPKAHH